jgi:hypothetical protein
LSLTLLKTPKINLGSLWRGFACTILAAMGSDLLAKHEPLLATPGSCKHLPGNGAHFSVTSKQGQVDMQGSDMNRALAGAIREEETYRGRHPPGPHI